MKKWSFRKCSDKSGLWKSSGAVGAIENKWISDSIQKWVGHVWLPTWLGNASIPNIRLIFRGIFIVPVWYVYCYLCKLTK